MPFNKARPASAGTAKRDGLPLDAHLGAQALVTMTQLLGTDQPDQRWRPHVQSASLKQDKAVDQISQQGNDSSQALREVQHHLTVLLDNTTAPVGHWGIDQRNRFGNPAHETWFGIKAGALPGAHLRDVIGEQAYEICLPHLQSALGGHPSAIDWSIDRRPADASPRLVRSRFLPDVDDQGLVQGFYTVMAELTPDHAALALQTGHLLAALDEARSVILAKSAFLASMSHEIRTPMNAIMGLSRLALQDHLPDKAKTYIDKVHDSSVALMGILDDVLDFSKIEAGQMRVEHVPMHLEDVLAHVSDLFCARLEQQGLSMTIQLAPDVPRHVLGDPLRLSQVINNLVGNAVKFTPQGGITVTVARVSPGDDTDDRVRFAIHDTGIGMTREALAHLFEAFVQADDSMTRRFGGSGLGLAICKQLVALMDGEIGVRSEAGQGCEFWFVLPLPRVRVDAEEIRPDMEAAHRDRAHASRLDQNLLLRAAPLQGTRILLAEDNRLNQIVAAHLLERLGLEVAVVETGQEAVQALQTHAPDHFTAVLMDLHMPEMDGLEATRRVRALPALSRLPVIAMTAAAMHEDRANCLAAGMTDHIAKPIMPGQLVDALLKCLGHAPSMSHPLANHTPEPPMPREESYLGLDLRALLLRLHGNERLAWALLQDFSENTLTCGEQMAQLMATGDLQGAMRVAHDIKGCSANLGIMALSAAASLLEASLRTGHRDMEALSAFQLAHQHSLGLIGRLLLDRDEMASPPHLH